MSEPKKNRPDEMNNSVPDPKKPKSSNPSPKNSSSNPNPKTPRDNTM